MDFLSFYQDNIFKILHNLIDIGYICFLSLKMREKNIILIRTVNKIKKFLISINSFSLIFFIRKYLGNWGHIHNTLHPL